MVGKIFRIYETQKKKMEQLKRMDEITGLDESDKNALITNIREN